MSLRAAIYARKSTDDSDRNAEARSTAHQREQCTALIVRQGWTLDEAHVYVDEATSGAVFNRPGLLRFMEAVKSATHSKPRPFDVLVMYAEDRLGRDVVETGYLTKQIVDSGVRLFFADGTERKLGNSTDALLMAISNFGAAFERERASARVRDKMFAKAKAGHATGRSAFGYESVAVNGHKELRVNAAKAEIVRRIFDWCQEGFGIARIAFKLNEQYGGSQAGSLDGNLDKGLDWSATSVRDILTNPIYVGEVVFGRTRYEIRDGVQKKLRVPEGEWVRVSHPELRIVPDALWQAVQARKATTFATYLRTPTGRLTGKPERSALASKYLLAGMLRCGICGGSLVSVKVGTRASYVCWRHKSKGPSACTNNRMVPMHALHETFIETFKSDILTTDRLERVVCDLARSDEGGAERAAEIRLALETELKKVETKLTNLAAAVAEAGEVVTLVKAIKAAEREQRELQARLEHQDGLQKAAAAFGVAAYRAQVTGLLKDWQGALEAAPQVARQTLRKLLVSDITVTPREDKDGSRWFTFQAQGTYQRVFSGSIVMAGEDAGKRWAMKYSPAEAPAPADAVGDELLRLAQEQKAKISTTSALVISGGLGCRA